jgi:hypothetical protein
MATIMFTKFIRRYKTSQLYFETREDFIWRAVARLLSILTGFYSAISIMVAPLILSNRLPPEEWIRMSLLFWSIMLAGFVLLLLVLFIFSFFRKGRKRFDHIIKYSTGDLASRRLKGIENRLDKTERRLDKIEQRVGIRKRWRKGNTIPKPS